MCTNTSTCRRAAGWCLSRDRSSSTFTSRCASCCLWVLVAATEALVMAAIKSCTANAEYNLNSNVYYHFPICCFKTNFHIMYLHSSLQNILIIRTAVRGCFIPFYSSNILPQNNFLANYMDSLKFQTPIYGDLIYQSSDF